MQKIRKDDTVIVISGKDKGRTGTVLKLMLDKDNILVAGINKVKKHQKANPQANIAGGIIEKEMPLDYSNVMLYNPVTKKGDRVRIVVPDDGGKKYRVFASNGDKVDI